MVYIVGHTIGLTKVKSHFTFAHTIYHIINVDLIINQRVGADSVLTLEIKGMSGALRDSSISLSRQQSRTRRWVHHKEWQS